MPTFLKRPYAMSLAALTVTVFVTTGLLVMMNIFFSTEWILLNVATGITIVASAIMMMAPLIGLVYACYIPSKRKWLMILAHLGMMFTASAFSLGVFSVYL
ncbi:hypothetical protein G4V62_16085 [Bacillaceae bacterium SIJ1]|uniref:hypothetical protein n=1 Tax=Litoribacterium kuwaitense TaxID=1398745 RepID=UPI0013ED7B4D|nr:hypothetical protein [Litoribacterium kuwaitense]NGP46391.1 hypothetical protein [Litoribacterium kuwaitense]